MLNTHRRRRRDAPIELRRVGVDGVYRPIVHNGFISSGSRLQDRCDVLRFPQASNRARLLQVCYKL